MRSYINYILISLSLLLSTLSYSQDSLQVRKPLTKKTSFYTVTPSILVASGLLFHYSNNHYISSEGVQREARILFDGFYTEVDDHITIFMIASNMALHFTGWEERHNLMGKLVLLFGASTINTVIVGPMKEITAVERPDGTNKLSFPSFHTSSAFMAAEMIRMEYGKTKPWVSAIAYSLAATTGGCLLTSCNHWWSENSKR